MKILTLLLAGAEAGLKVFAASLVVLLCYLAIVLVIGLIGYIVGAEEETNDLHRD